MNVFADHFYMVGMNAWGELLSWYACGSNHPNALCRVDGECTVISHLERTGEASSDPVRKCLGTWRGEFKGKYYFLNSNLRPASSVDLVIHYSGGESSISLGGAPLVVHDFGSDVSESFESVVSVNKIEVFDGSDYAEPTPYKWKFAAPPVLLTPTYAHWRALWDMRDWRGFNLTPEDRRKLVVSLNNGGDV